jgi:hypothetical protein
MPTLLHAIFLTFKLGPLLSYFVFVYNVTTVRRKSKIRLKKRTEEETVGEGLKQDIFQLGSHITCGTPQSAVLQSIFLNRVLPQRFYVQRWAGKIAF